MQSGSRRWRVVGDSLFPSDVARPGQCGRKQMPMTRPPRRDFAGRAVALGIALCLSLACGSNSGSPSTVPSAPAAPQVAGVYRGPLTITFSLDPSIYLSGNLEFHVVQSGWQLTITGTTWIAGVREPVHAMTGSINSTGYFRVEATGAPSALYDPNCGTMRGAGGSLTFSGGTARWTSTVTTDYCGIISFSSDLRRQ